MALLCCRRDKTLVLAAVAVVCGKPPQQVSLAVRFIVPLALPGQAKTKFTACGDRRTGRQAWMLAKKERERERLYGEMGSV